MQSLVRIRGVPTTRCGRGRKNQSLSPSASASATSTTRFRNGHARPRHYRLCRVSERRARALLGCPQATAHQGVRRALGYLRARSCPDGLESRQARTLLVLHTRTRARVRGGGLGDRWEPRHSARPIPDTWQLFRVVSAAPVFQRQLSGVGQPSKTSPERYVAVALGAMPELESMTVPADCR
jgi:hypothetical protein